MAKQTFTTGQVLTAAQMTSLQQTAMGGGSTTAKTASYVLVAADAGTVVQMNAAGATTITVNTALFANGDVVFLQNIGAGICTITAGTATVSTAGSLALTQFEGGQLYFTAAGASVFFDYIQAGTTLPLTTKGDVFGFDTANARIPIGANNTVLTADSAQALGLKWAAGPSLDNFSQLGSTTNLSGSSTVTISGISGANKIMVLIGGNASTNASGSYFRFRINTLSTSIYNSNVVQFTASSVYSNLNLVGSDEPTTSEISLVGMAANAASFVATAITLQGCNTTGLKQFAFNGASSDGGSSNNQLRIGQGFINTTALVTSVSILTGSAATFDAGTISVYVSA